MATKNIPTGDNSRQLAEKMAQLQTTYRDQVVRLTTELAEVKRQYEADCMQLLRGGIQDLDVSLGDVEGQSASPGSSLMAPCTACTVTCATDI